MYGEFNMMGLECHALKGLNEMVKGMSGRAQSGPHSIQLH